MALRSRFQARFWRHRVLLLVAFLAYNIFHAFLALNVKPAARQGKTQVFWALLIAAELYSEVAPAGLSP